MPIIYNSRHRSRPVRYWPYQLAFWCALVLWAILMSWLLLYIISRPALGAEHWQRYAERACQRYGCDQQSLLLLHAIGTHEPDWREEQSIGDDLRSFGRYQIHIKTAIRRYYGKGYERRILLKEYAGLVYLLGDEAWSADFAAQLVTDCQAKYKLPKNRLRCYHGRATETSHARYLALVMPIYNELNKQKTVPKD